MKPNNSNLLRLVLLLGLCLCGTAEIRAQGTGRGGGGGGATFGGGGGGGGGRAGGGGGGAAASGASSTRDYPNSTMIGSASVSIDPQTHSVIVIGDDKTLDSIGQVVANMDRPEPQVLIKVVFVEVTHDDALDIGVEGSYNHSSLNIISNFVGTNLVGLTTNFLHSPGQINAGNNFGLAAQGTTGSIIGGNTMPTGAGLYSVLGSDYTATIRAIASSGKSEVLSRPSVMVRNNQPATIQVGQSIPIITSVTYAANTGLPIVTPTYQPVGIILQVTPFIFENGLVEMIVAPQISALSAQTVAIAPGFNAPAIDIRSASTVVITPDGETVVIGGLIENDKVSVDTKIPILGDIPLLGSLFKRHQKDHTKKELLIFLTPHVVVQPSELASTTSSEADRAVMSRRAFTEQELNNVFDKIPLKKPDNSAKH